MEMCGLEIERLLPLVKIFFIRKKKKKKKRKLIRSIISTSRVRVHKRKIVLIKRN